MTHFREDFLKARVHGLLVEFVAVELKAFDEPLDGPVRLVREERETIGDITPLPGILGESETLA